MQALTTVLFALTLLLCGAYAGISLFCQIGVLPTMRRLDSATYVEVWGILDGLMERSMPPYKITLLAVTLGSAVCLYVQHHPHLATATAMSFLLSLAALILTLLKQVPLNRRIRASPKGADDGLVFAMRAQTETNFAVRLGLALIAFAVLCTGIIAFPILA